MVVKLVMAFGFLAVGIIIGIALVSILNVRRKARFAAAAGAVASSLSRFRAALPLGYLGLTAPESVKAAWKGLWESVLQFQKLL